MKRTPHLPSITKIQAHRVWSKKTGQNKPALLNHKNVRSTKDTKDAILKKDIRS